MVQIKWKYLRSVQMVYYLQRFLVTKRHFIQLGILCVNSQQELKIKFMYSPTSLCDEQK